MELYNDNQELITQGKTKMFFAPHASSPLFPDTHLVVALCQAGTMGSWEPLGTPGTPEASME